AGDARLARVVLRHAIDFGVDDVGGDFHAHGLARFVDVGKFSLHLYATYNSRVGSRSHAGPNSHFLWPLIVGASVRAAMAFFPGIEHVESDSMAYLAQAATWSAGGEATAFPPGYPLIISAITAIVPSHVNAALLALNVALGTITVLLTGMIAGRVGPRGAGRAAIWLAALWPHQLHYVRYILSEVPATALLVGSAWLFCASRC